MFSKIYALLKSIINATLDLSLEKVQTINELNKGFREQYLSGEALRYVTVSITIGDSKYRHSMSSSFLRSGFMLVIQNDEKLTESEANEIAKYILDNEPFVRKLMVFGFDTLIVKGKTTRSMVYKMSEYATLNNYFMK